MSCEHLVCASCAGPVEAGRCPVCRSARGQLHHRGAVSLSPQLVVFVAVVAALASLLLLHARL